VVSGAGRHADGDVTGTGFDPGLGRGGRQIEADIAGIGVRLDPGIRRPSRHSDVADIGVGLDRRTTRNIECDITEVGLRDHVADDPSDPDVTNTGTQVERGTRGQRHLKVCTAPLAERELLGAAR
jgi:hypothetical protein